MHKNLQLFYVLIVVTAAALGVRWYLNGDKSHNLSEIEAGNFAIEDTSSVTRIVIADKDGYTADLRRETGARYWTLNNRFPARKDAVDLLLKTMRRIAVKGPVSEAEKPTVMRMMAGRAKKVEIFTEGGVAPLKTWYIGTPTQSHTGTYMLLETRTGMAEEPFITHMEGFTGFLSTRFFTDEREWRYTGVFDHPGRTLKRIECEVHAMPEESWALEVQPDGGLVLTDADQIQLPPTDTLALQNLFLRYRKVHLETYNNHLSEEGIDSLLNTASPAFTLRAWGESSMKPDSIQLYWKAPISETYDDLGRKNKWDGSRMYGRVNGDEVVLVQRFVFDPLIVPLTDVKRGFVQGLSAASVNLAQE
jgi:hypothetical protein